MKNEYIFHSPLPLQECITKLKSLINDEGSFLQIPQNFYGTVNDGTFHMYQKGFSRSSIDIMFTGTMNQIDGGQTEIKGQFGMRSGVKIALSFIAIAIPIMAVICVVIFGDSTIGGSCTVNGITQSCSIPAYLFVSLLGCAFEVAVGVAYLFYSGKRNSQIYSILRFLKENLQIEDRI